MTVPVVVEGVNATPYEDNMRYFNVAIAGPVGTCYEGRVFSFFSIRWELLVYIAFQLLLC
jgi:ubiquitin-protein ligase